MLKMKSIFRKIIIEAQVEKYMMSSEYATVWRFEDQKKLRFYTGDHFNDKGLGGEVRLALLKKVGEDWIIDSMNLEGIQQVRAEGIDYTKPLRKQVNSKKGRG